MTRKHFRAIADIMKEARKRQYSLERVCEKMADYLCTENGLFNRSRFLNACEPDETTKTK